MLQQTKQTFSSGKSLLISSSAKLQLSWTNMHLIVGWHKEIQQTPKEKSTEDYFILLSLLHKRKTVQYSARLQAGWRSTAWTNVDFTVGTISGKRPHKDVLNKVRFKNKSNFTEPAREQCFSIPILDKKAQNRNSGS